jgi:hypothetical protein
MRTWIEIITEAEESFYVMGKIDGKQYKSKRFDSRADAQEYAKTLKEKHGGMFVVAREKAFA